jgi:hypothetical protein
MSRNYSYVKGVAEGKVRLIKITMMTECTVGEGQQQM